jgi:hypothetical protein
MGISALERENVQLAKALIALGHKIDGIPYCDPNRIDLALKETEDHEARIAFLENRLTAKGSEAKIVPKAKPVTFRQFAAAASVATETEDSNG